MEETSLVRSIEYIFNKKDDEFSLFLAGNNHEQYILRDNLHISSYSFYNKLLFSRSIERQIREFLSEESEDKSCRLRAVSLYSPLHPSLPYKVREQ